MRKAIDLYKNYGMYVNTGKMLPSIRDGLLPVHRRMLLVLHNIASTTKVKTVTANGEMLGKYHPHAESSGPAEWAVNNEFAIGYGLWGSNIGIEPIEPAAPRYTSIKSSVFVEKTIMPYIKYVPWNLNELDFEEPEYLPTPFPFCIIGKQEISSMGFGNKAEFPIYTKIDLCRRLLFLLNKTDKDVVIKPYMPNCDILSPKKDIKKLLTGGLVTLKVQGQFKEDEKNGCIYITGWAPRTTFKAIYNKIARYKKYDLFESGSVGMLDESNDKHGNRIRFEVLKQRNVSDTYEKMKEAISESLKDNVRYAMYVVNEENDQFKLSNVDEMLLTTYKYYTKAYNDYCTSSINKLNEQLTENANIEKLKPHISAITVKNVDLDKVIANLSKLSGVSIDDVKYIIEKYHIKKLLSYNTDKTVIQTKLKEFQDKQKHLEKSVLEEYKASLTL